MAMKMTLVRAFSAASVVRFFSAGGSSPACSSLLSPSTVRLGRSHFFGCSEGLRCEIRHLQKSWNPSRSLGARAKIKRRKDSAFDSIIQREKKVKIVSKIKEILVKQPGRTMTLLSLGKHRRNIGLTGRRRVVALLERFPAVFEVFEEGCNLMCVRFTPEAARQYEEEQKLKEDLEVFLVEKLRKLVMMSVDKRLTLDKISHLKKDLGLPEDFKTSILPKYPQFFKEVETGEGPALELTFWDPLLAVSAAQKKLAAAREDGEDLEPPKIIVDGEEIKATAISSKRLNLPKGLALSKKDRVVAMKFQQMPYMSPYADASGLDPASTEAEKRACAVVAELLSLTLEKKTLVDHLTHFKKDYKFSQRIRAMLIRHPELFYVSFKGHRDSVFLREAYNGSELIDKDPLVLAKERLAELVAVSKQQRARERAARRDGDPRADEDDEDDDCLEGDSDEDDEDDDDDDDWGDDEGEVSESAEGGRALRPRSASGTQERDRATGVRPSWVREPSELAGGVENDLVASTRRPRERW